MSRRWWGMISQYKKWKNKRRYQGGKREKRKRECREGEPEVEGGK